nr:hypothetical protein [Phenylobacterium sp.]
MAAIIQRRRVAQVAWIAKLLRRRKIRVGIDKAAAPLSDEPARAEVHQHGPAAPHDDIRRLHIGMHEAGFMHGAERFQDRAEQLPEGSFAKAAGPGGDHVLQRRALDEPGHDIGRAVSLEGVDRPRQGRMADPGELLRLLQKLMQ